MLTFPEKPRNNCVQKKSLFYRGPLEPPLSCMKERRKHLWKRGRRERSRKIQCLTVDDGFPQLIPQIKCGSSLQDRDKLWYGLPPQCWEKWLLFIPIHRVCFAPYQETDVSRHGGERRGAGPQSMASFQKTIRAERSGCCRRDQSLPGQLESEGERSSGKLSAGVTKSTARPWRKSSRSCVGSRGPAHHCTPQSVPLPWTLSRWGSRQSKGGKRTLTHFIWI